MMGKSGLCCYETESPLLRNHHLNPFKRTIIRKFMIFSKIMMLNGYEFLILTQGAALPVISKFITPFIRGIATATYS